MSRHAATLRGRAEAYAERTEDYFEFMRRGAPAVPATRKMTRAWLDGYNAGRLAKHPPQLLAINPDGEPLNQATWAFLEAMPCQLPPIMLSHLKAALKVGIEVYHHQAATELPA